MGFMTSDRFVSAAATGADWRDAGKKVLEQLAAARKAGPFNFGFLYMTEALAPDAESILTLFRSVTRIENWTGSVGAGVFAADRDHVAEPALSVMLTRFAEDDFRTFPAVDLDPGPLREKIAEWRNKNETVLTMVHGNGASMVDPAATLLAIETAAGGFVAGGFSSARRLPLHISGARIEKEGISGAVFSSRVPVAATLTQGCAPAGNFHTITKCEENVILELDGRRATDVLIEDLKIMAARKAGVDPASLRLQGAVKKRSMRDLPVGSTGGDGQAARPQPAGSAYSGEVHLAFPIAGSDQGEDYLVRSALDINQEKGSVKVAHHIIQGERTMFVHRDEETVKADLSRTLLALRARLSRDGRPRIAQGAVYISSVARILSDYDRHTMSEIKLIREILGDIPLTGFYANGEISKRRLYGYSGILLLFL